MIGAVFLLAVSSLTVCHGAKWALLVAGSEGWGNYRHQADVCHAYQVLRDHGIPVSNIVLMMKNDIAHNPSNPVPGSIINSPGGANVYKSLTIDYSGSDLSPDLFYKVLKGDSAGVRSKIGRSGKVINSGSNDEVFLYYSDHGGVGILGFVGGYLHASDLNNAFKYMKDHNKYKEMLVYIEACHSGSMFKNRLATNTKVYATTAANPDESSYAAGWDSKVRVWTGDQYSVNWMHDSDTQNLNSRTVKQQFDYTKAQTTRSHAMKYGDTSMESCKVGEFQGSSSSGNTKSEQSTDVIRSDLVEMDILKKRIAEASEEEANGLRAELDALIQKDADTDEFFKNMVALATNKISYEALMDVPVNMEDYACHKEGTKLIYDLCPGMTLTSNYRALKNLKALANLCDTGVSQEKVMSAIARSAHDSTLC